MRTWLPIRRFTLIEVLVSMSIMMILGGALILILRGGVLTWRQSEARRESFDQAQAIFLQLREDLAATVPPFSTPLTDAGNEVEARFVCDKPNGLQRLFLVRSIKAESEHPITGHAGSAIAADSVIDQRDDLAEARQTRLRATGGAMEIAWVLGADGVLYRGVKTPIGPPHSLFADTGAYELAPPPGSKAPKPDLGAAPPPPPGPPPSTGVTRPALLRPFATDVIHLEFLFWTQYTRTWGTRFPPLRVAHEDERSGPMPYWDSTRALIAPPKPPSPVPAHQKRQFHTFLSRASLYDPRDDILPASVRVTIVLKEADAAGSHTYLAVKASARDTELTVKEPGRLKHDGGYVYINGEWIKYDEVRKNTIIVSKNGRGVRGTLAAAHDGSQPVVVGRTFTAILDVPAYREDWGDRRTRRNR